MKEILLKTEWMEKENTLLMIDTLIKVNLKLMI
jgi:hypothetical protein